MKINEVEEKIGISKANIRFYEKQGLITPARGANGYREYTQDDVALLQNVVILRKLGIPVQDIERIFKGEIPLQEAVANNITRLEEQIEELNGSLRLSRQIAQEQLTQLDTGRYWQIIQEKEAQGERFAYVFSEYWIMVMEPIVMKRFLLSEGDTIKKRAIQIAVICGIYALARTFLWKDGHLIGNFFYWPMIIAVVALITFPIFWLGKHHPKAASVLNTVLAILCAIVLGGAILLAAGGLLAAAWNTVFG